MDASQARAAKGKRVKHVAVKKTRPPPPSSSLSKNSEVPVSIPPVQIPSLPHLSGVAATSKRDKISLKKSGSEIEDIPSTKNPGVTEQIRETQLEKFRRILKATNLKIRGKPVKQSLKTRKDVKSDAAKRSYIKTGESFTKTGAHLEPIIEETSEEVAAGGSKDPEFEEILRQADCAEKKAVDKPESSRRSLRRKSAIVSSDDSSDSDSVEILEPSSKKAKVEVPISAKSGKTQAAKQVSAAGGEIKNSKSSEEQIRIVDGVWLSSKRAEENWFVVKNKRIVVEGIFVESKWSVPEVAKMLEEAQLMKAVKAARPFDEGLVRELIANISESFGDPKAVNYGCVSVRGVCVIFSPRLINEILGIGSGAYEPFEGNWDDIAHILTGGRVRKWKGHSIESKFLTTKYALLQGICIRNWIPGPHRATISRQTAGLVFQISDGKQPDLGQIIFNQLASYASVSNSSLPIGHPSTIYQLLIRLAPGLANTSSPLTNPKPLIVDWKVFSFGHVVDIVTPVSIKQALKRSGKAVKTEPSSSKSKSEVELLKEQLAILDRAREIAAALLAEKEKGQKGKESSESSSESD